MQSQSPVLDRRQLRLAESVGAGHAPPARVALPFTVADGLPLLSRASNVRLPASGRQPLKRSPSARQGLSALSRWQGAGENSCSSLLTLMGSERAKVPKENC